MIAALLLCPSPTPHLLRLPAQLVSSYLLLPLLVALLAWLALSFPQQTASTIGSTLELIRDHSMGASSLIVVLVAVLLGPSVLTAAAVAGILLVLAAQASIVPLPRLPAGAGALGPAVDMLSGQLAPLRAVQTPGAGGQAASSAAAAPPPAGLSAVAKQAGAAAVRAAGQGASMALEKGRQALSSEPAQQLMSQGGEVMKGAGQAAARRGAQLAEQTGEVASGVGKRLAAAASDALGD